MRIQVFSLSSLLSPILRWLCRGLMWRIKAPICLSNTKSIVPYRNNALFIPLNIYFYHFTPACLLWQILLSYPLFASNKSATDFALFGYRCPYVFSVIRISLCPNLSFISNGSTFLLIKYAV